MAACYIELMWAALKSNSSASDVVLSAGGVYKGWRVVVVVVVIAHARAIV